MLKIKKIMNNTAENFNILGTSLNFQQISSTKLFPDLSVKFF